MEEHLCDTACDGTEAYDMVIGHGQQYEFFVKGFCEETLPPNPRALVFWTIRKGRAMSESKRRFLSWLEDAAMRAIESRRLGSASVGHEGNGATTVYYPHLKTIYPEEIETVPITPCIDQIVSKRLIEIRRKAGVGIHTLANRAST